MTKIITSIVVDFQMMLRILTCIMVRSDGQETLDPDEMNMILSGKGILGGVKAMLPVGIFVIPYGLAYGVAAIEHGLSPFQATAMSILVFSGAAQFAVLELWQEPLLYLPIGLIVLAVSSRHIFIGAALSPWLRHLPSKYLTIEH